MQANKSRSVVLAGLVACCALTGVAFAAEEWTMWGGTPNRNMVVPDAQAPTKWNVETGENVQWIAQLGTQSYGNPVIAEGVVWVGTNNEARYDPKFDTDGGVLASFKADSGEFLWQNYSAKLKAGRVNDWPFQGICCSPLIEKSRLWYSTSRCEVICLDISEVKNGGPAREVWKLDMMEQLGVFPHNMTSASPVAHGDLIYIITGNGVDESHKNIPSPEAPAVIAINKHNGKVAWQANPVKENILHGQWASAAVAEVNGKAQVIAPLGDGWIYGFDALTGDIVWKFDSNDKDTIYPRTRNELIATPVIVENRLYIANGQDPEHGEGPGHLWCIDVTRTGDISRELEEAAPPQDGELLGPEGSGRARKGKPNPNSGVIWDFKADDHNGDGKIRSSERMNRTISTVAVSNGLVLAPDFSGYFHCLDAKTGKHLWTYDMEAAMWGSPLVVGDKVYIGDEDGDIAIFKVAPDGGEPIAEIQLESGTAVYGSPVFANGTLYIMAKDKLFAIKEGATGGHQKGAKGKAGGQSARAE